MTICVNENENVISLEWRSCGIEAHKYVIYHNLTRTILLCWISVRNYRGCLAKFCIATSNAMVDNILYIKIGNC